MTRKVLALGAFALLTACAAPEPHSAALIPGERFSDDVIIGDPDGAHEIRFGETVGTNLRERLVTVDGHRALVRALGVSSGFVWIGADGEEIGHGHGGYPTFEVMPGRNDPDFPDGDLEFLTKVYDASCKPGHDGESRLGDLLLTASDPESIVETAEGGYYLLKGRFCPLREDLLHVHR